MTSITLLTGKNGVLRQCKVNGHACFSKKGSDIVCASVTFLVRTALQLLSQTEGVCLDVDTSSRGNLAFCVEERGNNPEVETCLKYTAKILKVGFVSLSEEYPKNVSFCEAVEAGN
ncbi:ribosomal-processing cysteine protease Prp [Treponema pectinovorum]|uniref:ribosomal-processing cysteine protease Prp n=1 Tax=Treponema pectinovorum TaxID=164 RepID=UPI0011C93CB7|nr:ribosomal-processing cysteine protease Prp [Treponema pectinovorum]